PPPGIPMALRPWLDRVANETVTVRERVGRELEVTRRILAYPTAPVHFLNLDGAEAAANVWSTRDRVAASLNLAKDALLPKILDAQAHPKDARVVPTAEFTKEQTTDVDLRDLPIPKLFPKDAGRYITAGVWVAEWQGVRNLSFHRILLLGKDRGACRIVPRHLRHMYNEATRAGDELPVAVCIGLDPWNLLAGGPSVAYVVDAIFHISVGGVDEHFMFMGMPREPVIYQAVSRAVPYVKAVRLTEGGCAWLHGVVSIRKQHQGDGKNAIMAAFGAHTSMKQVVIVDEDVDVFDDRDVEWAIATRFQADRGLVVLHDVRGSSIDPSARDGFTSKMGI